MTATTFLCVDDDTTVLNALRTLLGKSLGKDFVPKIAKVARKPSKSMLIFKKTGSKKNKRNRVDGKGRLVANPHVTP